MNQWTGETNYLEKQDGWWRRHEMVSMADILPDEHEVLMRGIDSGGVPVVHTPPVFAWYQICRPSRGADGLAPACHTIPMAHVSLMRQAPPETDCSVSPQLVASDGFTVNFIIELCDHFCLFIVNSKHESLSPVLSVNLIWPFICRKVGEIVPCHSLTLWLTSHSTA